jgi:hypothetical protein
MALLVYIVLGGKNPNQNAGSANPLAGLVFCGWLKVKRIPGALDPGPSCYNGL